MKRQMGALYENHGMPEAWDDMNNVFLEPDKVTAARAEEMSFFKKLGVYRRVPRAMIKQDGRKIVTGTSLMVTVLTDGSGSTHRLLLWCLVQMMRSPLAEVSCEPA